MTTYINYMPKPKGKEKKFAHLNHLPKLLTIFLMPISLPSNLYNKNHVVYMWYVVYTYLFQA